MMEKKSDNQKPSNNEIEVIYTESLKALKEYIILKEKEDIAYVDVNNLNRTILMNALFDVKDPNRKEMMIVDIENKKYAQIPYKIGKEIHDIVSDELDKINSKKL